MRLGRTVGAVVLGLGRCWWEDGSWVWWGGSGRGRRGVIMVVKKRGEAWCLGVDGVRRLGGGRFGDGMVLMG